jgi:hypothetical protein
LKERDLEYNKLLKELKEKDVDLELLKRELEAKSDTIKEWEEKFNDSMIQ